jgi:hypothetical protein
MSSAYEAGTTMRDVVLTTAPTPDPIKKRPTVISKSSHGERASVAPNGYSGVG